jgi:hypothetical protein
MMLRVPACTKGNAYGKHEHARLTDLWISYGLSIGFTFISQKAR